MSFYSFFFILVKCSTFQPLEGLTVVVFMKKMFLINCFLAQSCCDDQLYSQSDTVVVILDFPQ